MSWLSSAPFLAARLRSQWRKWQMPARWLHSGPTSEQAIRTLEPAIAVHRQALRSFGQESDTEFTALAQGLSRLNDKFTELRVHRSVLDRVVNNQDEDHAYAAAYRLYKRSVDLVHSSIGIALAEQEQMSMVEKSLRQAYTASERFAHNNMLLHILTMDLRMEAARIDADSRGVFLNVAAAVAETAAQISQSTSAAFARIDQVIRETSTERGQLNNLEKTLYERAQSSIATIHRELQALEAALGPCREESAQIGSLLDQTMPTTLRIITALQHQDIVRQKLEHVATGFDDIAAHMQNGYANDANTPEREKILDQSYLHHAARVQHTHLESARTEIEDAGQEVTSSLGALLHLGEDLLAQFTRMEQVSGKAFANFHVAEMFAREIEGLAKISDQGEQTNLKITQLVERISEVAQVFTASLSHHEFEVKLVALNAQIASARMPSAEALNKLAEEVNSVASDNAQITAELTAELQTTLQHLTGIKEEADEFLKVITGEREDLARSAQEVTIKLDHLRNTVRQSAGRLNQEFAEVYEHSQNVLGQLRFPALIGASFGPAEQFCRQLSTATAAVAKATGLSNQASERLEAHQGRYTMRQENLTHAAALGLAATDTAANEVELFNDTPATNTATAPEVEPTATHPAAPDPPTANSATTGVSELGSALSVPSPNEATTPDSTVPAPKPESTRDPASAPLGPAAPAKTNFGDGIELF